MKGKICFLLLVMFLLEIGKVNAQDVYTNAHGVEMEYGYYHKLCELFSEDYMEFVTQERYDELTSIGLDEIEFKEYVDSPLIHPLSALWETDYKIIKIVKSGSNITLLLTWKKMPSTRSYDVMAVRFSSVSLNGKITSKQVVTSNGKKTTSSGSEKMYLEGFGVSFLLPSGTISGLEEQIEFKYNGSGIVYGTYQHAQQILSLADSMSYSISSTGLGKVLLFNSSTITNKYDNMMGVDLKV